ncbi:MAG: hypothetical protein NVSMB68_10980 [Thermoanaerobaculia bacterium]
MVDRPARVLIADSDPALRRDLYQRLLEADVFADSVGDGRSALEKLETAPYAVVVLDVTLQQVPTERLLDCIAHMPQATRPVVIVLAARNAARSLDVDVVQIVMRKPCDILQLADIVKSCVRSATEVIVGGDEPTLRIRPVA